MNTQNRIEELKQIARETEWCRQRKLNAPQEVRRLWYKTYDELESLMDEEAFEDFIWELDAWLTIS